LTFSGISTALNFSCKKVTDSINCEELAAARVYMDPEQSPSPQEELDWCVFVCVGINLIDKSKHWA